MTESGRCLLILPSAVTIRHRDAIAFSDRRFDSFEVVVASFSPKQSRRGRKRTFEEACGSKSRGAGAPVSFI